MHATSIEASDEPKTSAGDPEKRVPAIIRLILKGKTRHAHTLAGDSRRRHPDNNQIRLLYNLAAFIEGKADSYPFWLPTLADVMKRKSVEACADLEAYLTDRKKLEEAEFCELISEFLVEDAVVETV